MFDSVLSAFSVMALDKPMANVVSSCFSFAKDFMSILSIFVFAGIYPLVAWEKDSQVTYSAEASTLTVGTCMEWLKNMNIIENVECSSDLANSVPDTNGCYFVPAFSGLSVSQHVPKLV